MDCCTSRTESSIDPETGKKVVEKDGKPKKRANLRISDFKDLGAGVTVLFKFEKYLVRTSWKCGTSLAQPA
jgi:hypothetical protein